MKKKLILLVIGIAIGVLAIIQMSIPVNAEAKIEAPNSSTKIEVINQNTVVLKTVAYYVLSFVKHQ